MPKRPPAASLPCLVRAVASSRWLVPLFLALIAAPALAAGPSRNVLVLYSDNRVLPGLTVLYEALNTTGGPTTGLRSSSSNEFLGPFFV